MAIMGFVSAFCAGGVTITFNGAERVSAFCAGGVTITFYGAERVSAFCAGGVTITFDGAERVSALCDGGVKSPSDNGLAIGVGTSKDTTWLLLVPSARDKKSKALKL